MNLPQVRQVVVCAILVALSISASNGGALAVGASDGPHASAEAVRFRAGVRNAPGKRRLNAEQLAQVWRSLREQTGWQTLAFDEEGFLVCPAPQVYSGGSESARRLLSAALSGAAVYELEAHPCSQTVSFARLGLGTNYESRRTGARISAYPVQIDFADFYQLHGPRPAHKAFDLGLVILHELAHGVWQLRDAAQAEEEPGECESFINRIRRELHLPERQTYRAHVYSGRFNVIDGTRLIAELQFVSAVEKPGQTKPKRYRLQWEAETVGPLTRFDQARLTAALR